MARFDLRTREGFTLIEVMAAMVIMTVGLFAVLNLQVVAVRGNTFARSRTDAQKIAQGVSDEIRTRALGWVSSAVVDRDWNFVFPDLPLTAAPAAAGENLAMANMRSVTTYQEKAIAADNAVTSAELIDVNGDQGPGAQYRVHYIAHQVPVEGGAAPSTDLVRVTVYVSWDSKDHGQQDYDWDDWWGSDGDNYFKRHVVSATQFVRKLRI